MPGKRPRTKKSNKSRKLSGLFRTGGFRTVSAKRPELKFVDYAAVSATPTTGNGNPLLLNGIQQGTGQFNRIGRLVSNKYLEIKWRVAPTTAQLVAFDPTVHTQIRVMCFVDHQANGASINGLSDVCTTLDQNGSQTYTLLSMQNMQNRSRFTILRDELLTLAANETSAFPAGEPLTQAMFSTHLRTWKIDLKGLKTTYKSTSNPSVIADISTNAIYLLLVIDSPQGGQTNACNIYLTARLRYYDV